MKLPTASAVLLMATPCLAEDGVASVYVDVAVACPGERYAAAGLTAAHRTLPCGSLAEVMNLGNGLRVVVRITDRGPHVRGRIVDLTPAAARKIGLVGLGPVRVSPVIGETARGEAGGPFEALWSLRAAPEP